MKRRIIVSGGGTGGHIYPAVAVADALTKRLGKDNVDILFVGAKGKMEMEKVPSLGYNISALPIAGLQRRFDWRNLLLPFKVLRSIKLARGLIKQFKAEVVVGFGGYASAPILWAAGKEGVPALIQEQNSYAGLTNKIVSKHASTICVAYNGMERFFPNANIIFTGNPLRGNFSVVDRLKEEALEFFGLDAKRPVILVVGGSLGTRTLNNMMVEWVKNGYSAEDGVQVIWQTGKIYEAEMKSFLDSTPTIGIWQGAFLERMDLAYAAADIVISRSGACTVSELCLVGKPTIFVPSPNVSEDHQTKNAMALVNNEAALMVSDEQAKSQAMPLAIETLRDAVKMATLRGNITKLATPNAAESIVDEIVKLLDANR